MQDALSFGAGLAELGARLGLSPARAPNTAGFLERGGL